MARAADSNGNNTIRCIINKALELWETELGRPTSARKPFKTILAASIHQCIVLQPETSEKSGNGNFDFFYGKALQKIKKQLKYDPTKTLPPDNDAAHCPPTTDFKRLAANDRD